MKQLPALICLILFSTTAYTQLELGVKAGIHSYDLSNITELELKEGDLSFTLDPGAATYGFQFGLYSRVKLLGIFIEPALLLNSTEFSYTLTDEDVVDQITKERFLNMDIPVLLGVAIFPFLKAKIGPVGHVHLDSSSDLIDIDGYSQTLDRLKYGYQLGLGLDILRIRADFLFEGNLSKFGDHITINDSNFSFDKNASRFIFNLGYAF